MGNTVRNKFVIATILLGLLTVVLLIWNISLVRNVPLVASERKFTARPMISYKANIIPKPIFYWTLTNPDAHILEAISNPDTWIRDYENETTFLSQVAEHNNVWKIEYDDSYYEIEAIRSYDVCIPKHYPIHYRGQYIREHISSVLVLGILWCLLAITWKKKG